MLLLRDPGLPPAAGFSPHKGMLSSPAPQRKIYKIKYIYISDKIFRAQEILISVHERFK